MTIFRFRHWSMLITCIFLYCFSITTHAQNNEVILSQKEIAVYRNSLAKELFDTVLNEFYQHKDTDSTKAVTVIKYLKNNFLEDDDVTQVIESHIAIASWEKKNGNLNEAIKNLDNAIKKATAIGDKKLLYKGYNIKGASFFENGKNEKALENYLIALELAKQTNNLNRQIVTSSNIILIKMQARDNLGAVALYLENLKRIENSDDKALILTKLQMYLGLTKAYINLENYEEAFLYANKGLQISKEENLKAFQAYFNTFLGEISSNNGAYEKAYGLFDAAKRLITAAGGDKNLDIFLKLYIGKTYYLEGKYEKAITELLEGERQLEKNGVNFLSIQELYVSLAESYLALENVQQSTEYFKKANEIDSKNDKTRAILNSRITQDSLKKLKAQIDALEKKSQRTKYRYTFGIGFLFLVIVAIIIYYKKQQRRNKERFNNVIRQLEEKRQQEKVRQQKITKPEQPFVSEKSKEINKAELELDEKTQEILKKLEMFEAKELFLSKESTLVEVAKKIQTNTTYLSKVINTYKEKSFTAYITDLRVDYAIERLSVDRKFRSFTIGAIAQEIGFKRSESFSKAFKVKTGLYPSYFIKELEKQ